MKKLKKEKTQNHSQSMLFGGMLASVEYVLKGIECTVCAMKRHQIKAYSIYRYTDR